MNKYYEFCKVCNLRDLVHIESQSSKTCFARTSAVKDYRRSMKSSIEDKHVRQVWWTLRCDDAQPLIL